MIKANGDIVKVPVKLAVPLPPDVDEARLADPFFTIEREYRFAFAKDKNAFVVNNIDYSLASQLPPFTGQHAYQTLRLGDLKDICRIVIS